MNFPNQISGTFNRNIILKTGFLKIYKDTVLFLTFTEADITVVGNAFSIDVTNLFPNNGSYYVNFTNGLFSDSLNGADYPGISNSTDWAFTIADGEYDGSEYSSTEYLTT